MTRFYEHLHSRSINDFLLRVPHYVEPGLNLYGEEDLENEICPSYNFMNPVPFLPPASVPDEVWSGKDPATELIRKKFVWRTEVDIHKRFYMRKRNKLATCERFKKILHSSQKTWLATARDAHFIKLMASNPDKHFDGVYNWYYTGGCLDTMNINNKLMLLSTQNNQLCIRQLKKKNRFWRPSKSSSTTELCKPDHPVYQLRASSETGLLCVRQRNRCHIYSLTDEMELQRAQSYRTADVFTSMDLSPHTKGTFATISSRRQVMEWDESGNSTFARKLPIEEKLEDRWSSISYNNDPHALVLVDRNRLYIMDKRTETCTEKISPKNETILGPCEDLCQVFPSCINKNAMYICSSHNVLSYDVRSSSKPLQHWTHLLRSAPLSSCTMSPQEKEEIICLASQNPGEMVTVINKWTGEQLHSYPKIVPNLQATLLAANTSGMWLDPVLQQRARLSLKGVTWLPSRASQLMFLSQTSGGDVFIHRQTTHQESSCVKGFTDQQDVKCLADWELGILAERTSPVLNVTFKKSLKHVYKFLKSSRNRLPKYEVLQNPTRQSWNISKAKLESYVDLLAPRILEVWEIEDMPDWGEGAGKSVRAELIPEQVDRVEEWLSSISGSFEVDKVRRTNLHCKEKIATPTLLKPRIEQSKFMDTHLSENVENEEASELDFSGTQSKKRKTIPKHEYVLGF